MAIQTIDAWIKAAKPEGYAITTPYGLMKISDVHPGNGHSLYAVTPKGPIKVQPTTPVYKVLSS